MFADADIHNAIKCVVSGIFAATGQACIAVSRALVQGSVYAVLRHGRINEMIRHAVRSHAGLQGVEKVTCEWALICTAHNFAKLIA